MKKIFHFFFFFFYIINLVECLEIKELEIPNLGQLISVASLGA